MNLLNIFEKELSSSLLFDRFFIRLLIMILVVSIVFIVINVISFNIDADIISMLAILTMCILTIPLLYISSNNADTDAKTILKNINLVKEEINVEPGIGVDVYNLPKELIIDNKKVPVAYEEDVFFYKKDLDNPYFIIEKQELILSENDFSKHKGEIKAILEGFENKILYVVKEIYY